MKEERFYLQVKTTGAIVAPRWVYMQPFLLWAEAMIAPNILFAEAYTAIDCKMTAMGLIPAIGASYVLECVQCSTLPVEIPGDIKKVLGL